MRTVWDVTYISPSQGGRTMRASLYLPNAMAVRREITRLGGHVLKVRPYTETLAFRYWRTRQKAFRVRLLRSIAAHSSEITSPGAALRKLIDMEEDARRRQVLAPAADVLARGGNMTEALGATRLFDVGTLAILEAGEASGKMRETVNFAISQIEQAGTNWRLFAAMGSALALETFVALTAIVSLLFGYIPYVRSQGIQSADPVKISDFYFALDVAWWGNAVLLAVFFCLVSFVTGVTWQYVRDLKKSVNKAAKVLHGMPLIGPFLNDSAMGEAYATLSRLLGAQVRSDRALQIVCGSIRVHTIRRTFEIAQDRISKGIPLGAAFSDTHARRIEVYELAAQTSTDRISQTLLTLSQERVIDAQSAMRNIKTATFCIAMGFIVLSCLSSIGVLLIQSEGMMETLNSIGTVQ
jgi:type II secretory pathway component PulF